MRVTEPAVFVEERKTYLTDLLGYFRQEFPHAQLYFQQTGAYQVGYDKAFKVESLADQQRDTAKFRQICMEIERIYDVPWIPKGEAALFFREESGLPDTLTARLGIGTNHSGDLYHDGDIGGGQLMTACVWFEILTGLSCLDSNYVPTYTYNKETFTLSDELVTAVRASAHKAVQTWFVSQ